MRHLTATLVFIGFIGIVNAHAGSHPAIGDTARNNCLDQADKTLEEALSLMQKHYYKREDFDWYAFSSRVKNRLEQTGDCDGVYAIINQCLREMGEKHSFVMPPARVSRYEGEAGKTEGCIPVEELMGRLEARLLAPQIGYLTVPWVQSTDDHLCTLVADSLQQLIARLDGQGVTKWVIDLRQNRGGNCWPMLTGLAPLLGEGTYGYFISNSEKIAISYAGGIARQGRYERCRISGLPYTLKNKVEQIVVLTGPQTSSAGEIVAIAFKGMPGVKCIGQQTAGFTTANGTYTLSDRSMLVLTVCREADRNGQLYHGRLVPDEEISPEQPGIDADPALGSALQWLQSL